MTHEDDVRRLLAQARHDEPMPPEVVARLDATLADLVAERQAPAPVIDLATRRRRRRASLVLAAAAVVVAGVGLNQVTTQLGGAGSGSDSAASLDAGGEASDQLGAAEPDEQDGRGSFSREVPEALASVELTDDRLRPRLRELRRDAARQDVTATTLGCPAPVDAPSHEVTYRGTEAVAVFHDPVEGRQLVEIYACGSSRLLRSLTLRAP